MDLRKFLIGYLFSVIFVLFFVPGMNAQTNPYNNQFLPHWQVGVNGGTSLFFGDIKQNLIIPISNHVNEWRFAFSVHVGYQISPVFMVGLQCVFGNLSGTRRRWNLYFDAEYFEANLITNINFNNLFGNKRKKRFFNVYGEFGIGLMQHNTEVKDLTTSRVIKTVGYGEGAGINGMTIEGVITYGMGFNFYLNDHWVIQIESVNRAINTDRLDGYEDMFPFDVYNLTSVGFIYKFGTSKRKITKIRKIRKLKTDPF
ncbi:MAG TPA: hypothetical protein ENH02_03400 [Bacteroidetes bacterium]|nr:hypothetical protein [Bacteroidota bacterium]